MPRMAPGVEVDPSLTILIVDDEATNVAVLQGVLESAGYQLAVASNGREALDLVARHAPDLILLDIMMPEIDGFEVCRRIKASPEWSDIPIIIITALDDADDYARAIDCGADDFMTKPFTFAVLLARVRGYLRAKQALDELRQSEERYRRLVELSPDAILVQCGGKIVFVNEAGLRLLGASTSLQLLGTPILDVVHPLYRAVVTEHIEQVNHRIAVPLLEEQYIRLDGVPVDVEVASIPIMYQDKPAGLMVVRDISERMATREALRTAKETAEAANLAKSQFLANMSHELRTPLNAIIGYSEMLQEEAEDLGQGDFLPDLRKIHTAGKHLLSLINDILDLSKIEAGKMTVCLETLDVVELIQDALGTIEPLVQKNANALEVHIAENVGTILSDLTKVQQCVLNLLSNACKFTEHGTIRLDVGRDALDGKDWLRLQVRDTGIGMTAEQIERLFQPFSQADASTTRKYGGTGLGLAITQRFCHMLGGDILVESTPGQGTTFTILLPTKVGIAPTAEGDTVEQPVSTVPEDAADQPDKPIILVIDDDPTARALLVRVLAKEGFQVVTAAHGQEGLRLARAVHPMAITLDVLMPEMDGWNVLTALKTDPALAAIPVLMLSITDNQRRGFALGAADFLMKPIDTVHLIGRLQQFKDNCASPPVLIVEDDPGLRELLRRQLQKAGWTVAEAGNGREALARLTSIQPAVILLDLMMPEMDGFTFLEELRKHDDWRAIPVIVVSAKDITPADQLRLNGAVTSILQKGSYTCEALFQQVRELVHASIPARS